jgi:RND superfamily putative drug exporter
MFDRLARLAIRWPRVVLLVSLVLVGLALVYGSDVASKLQTGGSTDPNSESALAAKAMDLHFSSGRPNLVFVVRGASAVDAIPIAAAGRDLTAALSKEPGISGILSYWQTGSPAMRSRDSMSALVVGRVDGSDADADVVLKRLDEKYQGTHGLLTVTVGGSTAVRRDFTITIREDVARAETIGIPIVAFILILVFRSFIAALLPLMVGLVAVIGTNATLKTLNTLTDVSIFSLNLATGLSLGLAVDYALFIVRRYREEVHRGADRETAIRITLNTAGRTVAFSSLTVAMAMAAMLIFPLYILRSFAAAGISVVLLAALAALVTLPAGLIALGKNVDALDISRIFVRVGRMIRGGNRPPAEPGAGWRRLAEAVMRRPLLYAIPSILFLLTLGLPFLHVQFGLPDDRLLPQGYQSHIAQQALRTDFDARPTGELDVVAEGIDPQAQAESGALGDYARRLSILDKVVRVQSLSGVYENGQLVAPPDASSRRFLAPNATYFAITSSAEDISTDSQKLVRDIRDTPPPFPIKVAGVPADLVDAKAALFRLLPWALGMIATTTIILIFLLTGSVLIPFKAVTMNILSLSATFGTLVWIFQDFHLTNLFSFQNTGWVDVVLLVLLFCVAFGVSMDYEVFLLSRIKEEYNRTRDNRLAVAYGIEKTSGVVTAAAVITSIVFIVMGTSRVTNIKMFGAGLALAVLMDAAVVRTLLVSALMRLAGRANWWAPKPLRWVYDRFGLREGPAEPIGESASPTPMETELASSATGH